MALKYQPDKYDGWTININNDTIEIIIKKYMYYLGYWYYSAQIEKINWTCNCWPMSALILIFDYTFNN